MKEVGKLIGSRVETSIILDLRLTADVANSVCQFNGARYIRKCTVETTNRQLSSSISKFNKVKCFLLWYRFSLQILLDALRLLREKNRNIMHETKAMMNFLFGTWKP